MKRRYAFWALSLLAAVTGAPREARARTCTAASDCPKGYGCEPAGVGPDGGPTGACVSLTCESNADCGPGLSCYLDMGTECMTAADGGQTCGPHNACVPQWDAPCLADSDCGPGYGCTPTNGGSFNCGKNQDAGQPPYAMVTGVPCSAVPVPPSPFPEAGFPPGFPLSICEAGTTCTEVTWKTCVAQKTGACSVDSDCPSTWTCGCPSTCSELPPIPGQPLVDAGCTMGCIPPNSDLDPFFCAGAVGAPSSFGPSASDGGDGVVEREGGAASGADSEGTHGGCQVGSGGAGIGWYFAAAAGLAWARGKRRRRRGAR
jgi:hypothetical protein